jgi:rubrerythrin
MAANGSTRKKIELNATSEKVLKEEKKEWICDACGNSMDQPPTQHCSPYKLFTDPSLPRRWRNRKKP